jgi:preprotein translocase subunit SecG
MYEALLVIFLLISIGLVALIMLQQGKGAEAGASFGAGTAGRLFGSSGYGNFITRITTVMATLFFFISLILGNLSSNKSKKVSEWENLGQLVKSEQTTVPSVPAKPSSDIPQ